MVSSKVSSRSREREGFRRPSDREDIVYRDRGQLGLHSCTSRQTRPDAGGGLPQERVRRTYAPRRAQPNRRANRIVGTRKCLEAQRTRDSVHRLSRPSAALGLVVEGSRPSYGRGLIWSGRLGPASASTSSKQAVYVMSRIPY